jgi:hypothetical protein
VFVPVIVPLFAGVRVFVSVVISYLSYRRVPARNSFPELREKQLITKTSSAAWWPRFLGKSGQNAEGLPLATEQIQ